MSQLPPFSRPGTVGAAPDAIHTGYADAQATFTSWKVPCMRRPHSRNANRSPELRYSILYLLYLSVGARILLRKGYIGKGASHMSQLPPFSRPGTVRAASDATLSHAASAPILLEQCPSVPSIAPLLFGRHASGRVWQYPQVVFWAGVPSSSTKAFSRSFHIARSSAEGAVPMRPG